MAIDARIQWTFEIADIHCLVYEKKVVKKKELHLFISTTIDANSNKRMCLDDEILFLSITDSNIKRFVTVFEFV